MNQFPRSHKVYNSLELDFLVHKLGRPKIPYN